MHHALKFCYQCKQVMRVVLIAEMRVQVAEMRLVQVAEMRLVQVAEMRLVQVAPSFSGRGGGGGGGGGQDRARGCHLTAANMLSAFGGFNQRGEGGGGCCPLLADSTSWVGAVCLLFLADSTSEGGGGGGGGCCSLSADSTSEGVLSAFSQFSQWGVRIYVNFYYGGGGTIQPPGDAHGYKMPEMRLVLVAKMRLVLVAKMRW